MQYFFVALLYIYASTTYSMNHSNSTVTQDPKSRRENIEKSYNQAENKKESLDYLFQKLCSQVGKQGTIYENLWKKKNIDSKKYTEPFETNKDKIYYSVNSLLALLNLNVLKNRRTIGEEQKSFYTLIKEINSKASDSLAICRLQEKFKHLNSLYEEIKNKHEWVDNLFKEECCTVSQLVTVRDDLENENANNSETDKIIKRFIAQILEDLQQDADKSFNKNASYTRYFNYENLKNIDPHNKISQLKSNYYFLPGTGVCNLTIIGELSSAVVCDENTSNSIRDAYSNYFPDHHAHIFNDTSLTLPQVSTGVDTKNHKILLQFSMQRSFNYKDELTNAIKNNKNELYLHTGVLISLLKHRYEAKMPLLSYSEINNRSSDPKQHNSGIEESKNNVKKRKR